MYFSYRNPTNLLARLGVKRMDEVSANWNDFSLNRANAVENYQYTVRA